MAVLATTLLAGATGYGHPNVFTAAGPPTAGDDNTVGYQVGDEIIDSANNTIYFCTNTATGAAKWAPVAGL